MCVCITLWHRGDGDSDNDEDEEDEMDLLVTRQNEGGTSTAGGVVNDIIP